MAYNYKHLFILGSLFSLLVLMFDRVGNYFNLYYFYPNFDIPMHFLGGFAVGFLALALLSKIKKIKLFYQIIIVLFIGIIWEVLEYYFKVSVLYGGNFYTDTALDLIIDTLGGILSYICFYRKIK